MRLNGAETLGLAWTLGTGDVASLGAVGMGVFALPGDIAGSDNGGVESPCVRVNLVALDGLVNALSLFSLSSFVRTPELDVSLCSTRFLLGAKTGAGLIEGSMGVGIAAFRRSSMSMRGAVVIGAKFPGRPAGFWKWPIAFASFRN